MKLTEKKLNTSFNQPTRAKPKINPYKRIFRPKNK